MFFKKIAKLFEIVGTARAATQLASMGYHAEAKDMMLMHYKAKQTIAELNALSNRELNDIGITRGDIHNIAYGKTDDLRSA
jgi:uncharacterized protein YjiS (DUF1127 family)